MPPSHGLGCKEAVDDRLDRGTIMTIVTTAVDDRAIGNALQAVIDDAPMLGVEEALARHGGDLPEHLRSQVAGLTTAELAELAEVSNTLGGHDAIAPDNNVNV